MNIIDLHKSVWDGLQAKRQRLPHALLLVGQPGIGKEHFTDAFVASLLCEAPQMEGMPCGECLGCRWLAQGNHPDFRRLRPAADEASDEGEADKNRGSREITVDQVRGLEDFMHVGTHRRGHRIILVEPAEAMNRPAANALLKTLEEPPPATVFLLVSGAVDRLLPTVRSRCQLVPVPLPPAAAALAWMRARGIGKAEQWLSLAGGAPLLAEELAGGAQGALLETMTDALAGGGALAAIDTAVQIDKLIRADRRDTGVRQVIEWTQRWCHDLALAAVGQAPRYFCLHRDKIATLAATIELPRLFAFNRKAVEAKRLADHPLNARLFLEDFLTDYATVFTRGKQK